MGDIRLTLACGAYDRTAALADGRVKPEGIDLTYCELPPAEIFWRQLQYGEFEVSEMSLSAYIMSIANGASRWVGIPAFPSRVFRRAYLFVNIDSGITDPAELKGKRVGVPEYHMIAALFIRGFLSDDYGVRAQDIEWVQGGQRGKGSKERVELPDGINVRHVADKTLDEMLVSGRSMRSLRRTRLTSSARGIPRSSGSSPSRELPISRYTSAATSSRSCISSPFEGTSTTVRWVARTRPRRSATAISRTTARLHRDAALLPARARTDRRDLR